MADQLSQRIFNISAEGQLRYREFVDVVKQIVPSAAIDLPPGHGPRHRPNAYLDITRLKQEVGYRPEYTIERALDEYIDWLRKHPE
jgi:UDP-glucose 4-epimerase